MKRKECFSEKKRSHLFESLFYKNGKAQNIPVIAARLVMNGSYGKIFSHRFHKILFANMSVTLLPFPGCEHDYLINYTLCSLYERVLLRIFETKIPLTSNKQCQ